MYEGNFFHKIKTNTIINAIFSTRFVINWNKDKGKFTIKIGENRLVCLVKIFF